MAATSPGGGKALSVNHFLAMANSLGVSPRVAQWLDFSAPGVVGILSDKVELGQGIATAMRQIAADALALPLAGVEVLGSDTARSANQGFTAGSLSVESGGSVVRQACLTAVSAMRARAAERLGCDIADIAFRDGQALRKGRACGLDYWILAQELPTDLLVTAAPGWDLWTPQSTASAPRVDLAAKVSGAAFIHDMRPEGLIHGRVLRPPGPAARLEDVPGDALEGFPDVQIVIEQDFVGFVGEREHRVAAAVERARPLLRWREEPSSALPRVDEWATWLMAQPAETVRQEIGQRPPGDGTLREISATYSRPPLAHASIAPSCALAQWEQDRLTVWSSTQGVFPLRTALALAFGLSEDAVRVIHRLGAGAYGHNGADDAAFDAARLAREVSPRPVRVQWTRADELAWSPAGAPMAVRLTAQLDKAARIQDWSAEIWSTPHNNRPGPPGDPQLLGASLCGRAAASPAPDDLTFVGADRNAEPIYVVPRVGVSVHRVKTLLLRTSALRTLGGFANVFALECFMDELAQSAGQDTLDFRLRHLDDPRARRVLEAAARAAGYPRDDLGLAVSRYKNTAAYAAAAAEVVLDPDLRVSRIWCAFDAGLLVNPDGARNQIEGGLLQGVSWTLKEQLRFDTRSVTSDNWETYPILRFDEAPSLHIEAIYAPDQPPLGVGEASQGVAAAAVANAFARASGLRLRDLPLDRAAVLKALTESG